MNTCSQQRRCKTYYSASDASAPCDLSSLPLAMAYVPMQHFSTVYELNEALRYGTIFPELNKPFMGGKGGCRH